MASQSSQRPPRIHRRSLQLYRQAGASPARQPFQQHVSDDEFVAAYLGYDNVRDLNALRFSSAVLGLVPKLHTWFLANTRRWEGWYLATLAILQYMECGLFKKKITDFRQIIEYQGTPLQHGPLRVAITLLEMVEFLAASNMLGDDAAAFPGPLQELRTHLSEFRAICLLLNGILGKPVVKRPVFKEDDEDMECVLRYQMLLMSAHEMTKLSVWRRMFPWTVATTEEE